MSLVKIQDTAGRPVYVNPDHVVLVSTGSAGGVPSVGESAVMLSTGIGLAIKGTPEEVGETVGGKEKSLLA